MSTEQPARNRLPTTHSLTLAYAASAVVALLMAMSSFAGLLYPTALYPSEELRRAFAANDVTNLVVGLPILVGSMWLARRGTLIGLLSWPGALLFVLYNYIVYLFAVPFNLGFLAHLLLVALSVYTVIGLVACIDGEVVHQLLAGAVPERAAGATLAGLGLLFLLRVVAVILAALASQAPMTETELALHVADILITPTWVIGGMLLWRRTELAYVVGLGLLFQASMLFVALIVVLLVRPLLTTAPFELADVVVIAAMGLVCFVPFALFARGVVSKRVAS